jgi:hypothetical protein
MKRFQLFFLAASIAGASSGGFFLLTMPAQAKQCSSERPANARSHWSYRLVDGRKCWYEGKPMLAKSILHWPLARARETHDDREPIVPENVYNLLDAQAFIPDNSEGFETRWRSRFLEAIGN